jgi:cyclophilin family peptidyl-prolyl cis-trans isomerase
MNDTLQQSPVASSPAKWSMRERLAWSFAAQRAASRPTWRHLLFEVLENRLALNTGPIVSFNTSLGEFKVQLFSDVAPQTVANFLAYVNSGAYTNSIIHRSVPGFVEQGGGFTSNSPTFTNISQLTAIPTNAPVQNEFSVSNTRGTIAMAKLGNDPNSATSQFFFNLANNASNLDNQNGGFTAFGVVLGNGMSIVDAMAAATATNLDPSNANTPFNAVPLLSGNQLVTINSVVINGSISGTAFQDFDGNGTKNGGDLGLAGLTVFIDQNNNGVLDASEVSTTTDANGGYTFTALDPGTYTVREVVPTGWSETSAASYSVTVAAGQVVTGKDFGQFPGAPVGVVLQAVSDTGASNSDGLTNLNNSIPGNSLQFLITGVIPGASVALFDGGTQIGQGTASGNSVVITTNGSTTLTDGLHHITATQSFQNATSLNSSQLNITVDATPAQFTTPPPALPSSVQAGTDVEYDFNATKEGQSGFVYSLVSGAPGMVINPQTGQISWQTDATQTGTYPIEVQAVDLAGNFAINPSTNQADVNFSLTVFNVPPTLAPIAQQTVLQNSTLQVQASATSPAGSFDVLTYSLASAPAGAFIDPQTGLFSWTPNASVPGGNVNVTIRATNASGQSSTETFGITVQELNHAPTINTVPSQAVHGGNTLTVTIQGVDSNSPAQTLTYSLDPGAPAGASIDPSTGVFTFVSTPAQSGTVFPVTVRVTDNGQPPMSGTATFNIGVDTAPLFTPIPQQSEDIGSTLSLIPQVAHLTPITFSLGAGAPAGASIDPTTGLFTWTPTAANNPGLYNITLRATDTSNLTGTTTLQVLVIQPNRAPVITPVNDQFVNTGNTLTLQIQASDPDSGQQLTYSLGPGAPAGVSIDPNTGLLTFTPTTSNSTVTQSVTIKVTDDGSPSLSSSITFNITTNPTENDLVFAIFRGQVPTTSGAISIGILGVTIGDTGSLLNPPGGTVNSPALFPAIDDILAVGGGSNFLSGPDTGVPHNSEWTVLPAQRPRFWGNGPVPAVLENPPQVNPNPINNQPNQNSNNGDQGIFDNSSNFDSEVPPFLPAPVQQVSGEVFWKDEDSWLLNGKELLTDGEQSTAAQGAGDETTNGKAAFSSPRSQSAKSRNSSQIQAGDVATVALGMSIAASRRRIEDKPSASRRRWGIERLER